MPANPSLCVMLAFLLTIVISPTISSVLGSPSTPINNSSTYPISNLSSSTPSTAQEEKNNLTSTFEITESDKGSHK